MPCQACEDAPLLLTYDPGPEPLWDVTTLDAGDYNVEVWGDPDVSKKLVLRFIP